MDNSALNRLKANRHLKEMFAELGKSVLEKTSKRNQARYTISEQQLIQMHASHLFNVDIGQQKKTTARFKTVCLI